MTDNSTRSMLESMYETFLGKFNDKYLAWDRMIDMMAFDVNSWLLPEFEHNFEWLFKDEEFRLKIHRQYSVYRIAQDKTDSIGQMYLERILGLEPGFTHQTIPPMFIARGAAEKIVPKTDDEVPIVCPIIGTGRVFIETVKRAPNAVYFGVDRDLRALRIAYLNFRYHGIGGFLLHANPDVHEIEVFSADGILNWQHSNRWNSHMDELKPKSTSKLYREGL